MTPITLKPNQAGILSIRGAEGAQAQSFEAVDAEIAAWQSRLHQVEEIRKRERPIKITAGALDDLEELRGFAMGFAERLDREGRGLLREVEREAIGYSPPDICLRFVRVARAVRQIVVLEQELLGLRPVAGVRAAARGAPVANLATDAENGAREDTERPDTERSDLRDRSDLDDLDDYDDRPADQVIAAVRRDLGAPIKFTSPRQPEAASCVTQKATFGREGEVGAQSAPGEGAVGRGWVFSDREEAPSPSFGIRPGCAGPTLRNSLPVGARDNRMGLGVDHRERAPP